MGIDVLAVIGDAAEVMGRDGYTAIPNALIAAGERIGELIAAARRAQDTNHDGYVLGRPDVSHMPEAERAAFLRGWDAASEAVYRTGLRAALSTLSEAR